MALVAEQMGWELLPWQRQVLDVACELTPDGSAWAHPVVIVSTPRQSGKSTLLGSMLTHRAMAIPDHHGWYTAQTGLAARDTWRKWAELAQQAWGDHFRMRMAAGTESFTFRPSRGFCRAFPPTPKSLHGQQGDTVVVDECWAFRPDEGDALLQAVVPTQATRPHAPALDSQHSW